MEFVKMHGLGNDFVIIEEENFGDSISDIDVLSQKICQRRFGVGADGLVIVYKKSDAADAKMRIFNSDGSEAEMCGNAIRCFAKYLFERDYMGKEEISIETMAGIMKTKLRIEHGKVAAVKVDMGEPKLKPLDIPVSIKSDSVIGEILEFGDKKFSITCVSMGNPHCVIFVPDLTEVPVEKWGKTISEHELFPNKTNVEFVEVLDNEHIKIRVWERGVGETLACGTGACAAVVSSVLNNKTSESVKSYLPGGALFIEWDKSSGHLYMTGSAEEVFVGKMSNI